MIQVILDYYPFIPGDGLRKIFVQIGWNQGSILFIDPIEMKIALPLNQRRSHVSWACALLLHRMLLSFPPGQSIGVCTPDSKKAAEELAWERGCGYAQAVLDSNNWPEPNIISPVAL